MYNLVILGDSGGSRDLRSGEDWAGNRSKGQDKPIGFVPHLRSVAGLRDPVA